MARPDPELVQRAQQSIPGWEKYFAETEPMLRFLTEHGCSRGEALIILSLNRIEDQLETIEEILDA